MKRLLKPIALNERSYNVNLLHKILRAFGLTAAKNETVEGKAGEDTLQKVRNLQEKLVIGRGLVAWVEDAACPAYDKDIERTI